MDLITGKAKEEFLKHENQPEAWLKIMQMSKSDTVLNALIIDWLDSVGIVLDMQLVNVHIKTFEVEIVFTYRDMPSVNLGIHKTRHQATQEAIKKAVEIYNKGAN